MSQARTLGILGGGQLGRMMAEAGHRLGVKCIVLDPGGDESPAGQVTHGALKGSFRDAEMVKQLASRCDVLTVEIEHIDCDALEELEADGMPIHPKPSSLRLIQDKFLQKEHFQRAQVPLGEFCKVDTLEDACAAAERFGYPVMLKARKMAYDGRGNAIVHLPTEMADAIAKLGSTQLYMERWVRFVKELAVMVVRTAAAEVKCYPVVDTAQKNSICHTVCAPAMVSSSVARLAEKVAVDAIRQIEGAGIFGVELFLLDDGTVLLNEIAPRPHNTGHYTIEACETDQHEQHVRAVLGLPLGGTALRVGAAVMLNILGQQRDDEAGEMLERALTIRGAAVHWYGKAGSRPERKLAHITVCGNSVSEIEQQMRAAQLSTPELRTLASKSAVRVAIIMGSDSDLPTMKDAAQLLEDMGVQYDLTIVSAHRTPTRMYDFASTAVERGIKVIIAGAGGAAHLPGMVAALTPLPVIGVPIKTSTLNGNDSLLSIVQMPAGIPVATVAIGNATNAALLAVRMLAISDSALLVKMQDFMVKQEEKVLEKASRLEGIKWQQYLDPSAKREVT